MTLITIILTIVAMIELAIWIDWLQHYRKPKPSSRSVNVPIEYLRDARDASQLVWASRLYDRVIADIVKQAAAIREKKVELSITVSVKPVNE